MSLATETTARSAEKYRVTRSRRNVAWTGLGALAVVVVLALFPYIVYSGTTSIMVQGFIILTLASMWNLLAGYAGLVSVGQQAFVGLGAYFVLILNIHSISMFTALPVAAVGCGVAALPMWWLVSRLRSGYFAIATWVLATTVLLIIEKFPSIGGGTGLSLPHTPNLSSAVLEAYTYWIGLAVTVLALLAVYLLLRSRYTVTSARTVTASPIQYVSASSSAVLVLGVCGSDMPVPPPMEGTFSMISKTVVASTQVAIAKFPARPDSRARFRWDVSLDETGSRERRSQERNIPQLSGQGDSDAPNVHRQRPGLQPDRITHGVPDRPGNLGRPRVDGHRF